MRIEQILFIDEPTEAKTVYLLTHLELHFGLFIIVESSPTSTMKLLPPLAGRTELPQVQSCFFMDIESNQKRAVSSPS